MKRELEKDIYIYDILNNILNLYKSIKIKGKNVEGRKLMRDENGKKVWKAHIKKDHN